MAFFSSHNVRLTGISACVPKREYDNMKYNWIAVSERKQLIKTYGIAKHRIAPKGVTTSDLCFHAAEKLILEKGWKKDGIDLLIFVSQARDYHLPASGIILQDRLGLSKKSMAFDIPLGCSGYVYGLSVAAGLLNSFGMKKALLLTGDISSASVSFKDKFAFPFFGDAGTATTLEYDETAPPMHFSLQTDGSGYDAAIVPHSGTRRIADKSSFRLRKYGPGIYRSMISLWLDIGRVTAYSVNEVPPNVNDLLASCNRTIDDIDQFVFHQASLPINETIWEKLAIPEEKYPCSLRNFGNTSSASIPITLITQLRGQVTSRRLTMLMSGFGVGFSLGSVILETDKIICPELLEV